VNTLPLSSRDVERNEGGVLVFKCPFHASVSDNAYISLALPDSDTHLWGCFECGRTSTADRVDSGEDIAWNLKSGKIRRSNDDTVVTHVTVLAESTVQCTNGTYLLGGFKKEPGWPYGVWCNGTGCICCGTIEANGQQNLDNMSRVTRMLTKGLH
jgi:hypothetical protein